MVWCYVFDNDKRQAGVKAGVKHFIKAPSDDIAINNGSRVYKHVSQEPDNASAYVKKIDRANNKIITK